MATTVKKERIISGIKDDLAKVVGASGNPEELVRLTTAIVQGTKLLLDGVPEDLSTRSTTSLAEFVKSARTMAKNPREVDAKAIQDLSSTRKAVERTVIELEKYHCKAKSPDQEELSDVMDSITRSQESRYSPEGQTESEKDKKLLWELQRKRNSLLIKMDPQNTPPAVGDVAEILTLAVKGLMRGANELTRYSEGKMPSKDMLLEPMSLVTDMVCKLLDVVDNLFVSKYPMRSQVYSFCSALIDNTLAYGCRSKADDVACLKNISTQTPALLNAAKVMVEQCEMRHSSLAENIDMSIKRNKELKQFDDSVKDSSTSVVKKQPDPPKPEPKAEFDLCCMVCTNVAVDQKTQQPISRGTELKLTIAISTTVHEVKQDLASRTGLLFSNIQLNQGQEELPDRIVINPNNPLPYFLFNRDEPTEDELLEKRKDERKKNRMRIDTLDWSKVTGTVAVALYEYDTLGDENNLAFDEGDIIEIIEKSHDGWWEGQSGDKKGSFPASFVEEIKSKEDGLRILELVKRANQLPQDQEEIGIIRHSSENSISTSKNSPRSLAKVLKNPMRLSRGMSSPDINPGDIPKLFEKEKEKGRKGVRFPKLKKNTTGYFNLAVFEEDRSEESQERVSPVEPPVKQPPKPLVKPKRSFGLDSKPVPKPPPKPLDKPKVLGEEKTSEEVVSPTSDTSISPTPQMNYRRRSPTLSGTKNTGGTKGSEGGAKSVVKGKTKKRPPPPVPQPFAKTHPIQAAKLNAIIQSQKSIEKEDIKVNNETVRVEVTSTEDGKEDDSVSNSIKIKEEDGSGSLQDKSSSMEDLLKNLQDFEESEAVERSNSVCSDQRVSNDFETLEPYCPVVPPPHDVMTIKVSDYKPDSEEDELDFEDEEGEEENEEEQQEGTCKITGVFEEGEEWNPREWMPSPEPVLSKQSRKPPSWSIDIVSSQRKNSGESSLRPSSNSTSPLPGSGKSSPMTSQSPLGAIPTKPVPAPQIISRPRKSPVGSPIVGSPIMSVKQDHLPKRSPPPVPPPRQKKKTGGSVGDVEKRTRPTRPPPLPPNKPSVRTSRSDMDIHGSKAPHSSRNHDNPSNSSDSSHLGQRRLTVSNHRENLRQKPPSRSRSPIVQRKTKAVVDTHSHLRSGLVCEDDTQVYTGVGKEGILYKEASQSSTWKPRYFHLVDDGLLYFDSSASSNRESHPLGELPINRIVKAMKTEQRDEYHCFIVLMRYETSILLGCHSQQDVNDWVSSINDVISIARLKVKPQSYTPSLHAAEHCLWLLINSSTPLDKKMFKLSGDLEIIKDCLTTIERGEDPDVSVVTNPSSALCLLKALLSDDKLGYLVPSEIAKEISQQVKKSAPIRDIQSKLHHIHDDLLYLLQLFLAMFSKALQMGDRQKLEVSDLNRMFGSALFEGLKSNQSLTLLAYLTDTQEMIFQ